MEPIEPGCLCLVIGTTKAKYAHYIGKHVIAIRPVVEGEVGPTGLPSMLNGIRTWLARGDGIVSATRLGHEVYVGGLSLCAEHNLMRIDGHEEQENQREAELCTHHGK